MLITSPTSTFRSVVSIALSSALAGVLAGQASAASVQQEALRYFEGARASGLDAYLKAVRPPRLPAEARLQVLASLPPEGEVQPADRDKPKLAALQRVFHFHDRGDVLDVKVIRVFQAFVGYHARSVVLISEHALRLLKAEELQALVAHELGHEYFWDEYTLAREQNETRRLQELELRCDGVALITMFRLGLPPSHLASAVAKINRFNARFGTPLNVTFYVSEQQRTRFIEAMADLVSKDSGRPARLDRR